MDLSKVLAKTKIKSQQQDLPKIPPASIATSDRPYDLSSKNEYKLKSNLSQIEAKLEPKLSQTEVKLEPKLSQIEAKLEPKPRPKLEPKLSQTEVKLEPKIPFAEITGLQRRITFFIHDICQNILAHETYPLAVDSIATHCKSTKNSIRKAIQRLENKGILIRHYFKSGRGGWTQYKISEAVYQEINEYKLKPNLSQTEAKVGTELRPKPEPTAPSSSSGYIINKNTTTGEVETISFAWQSVDITPLKDIGFTLTHLQQIAQQERLTVDVVQDSIYAFAFDLEQNNKQTSLRSSPLNYFMGILRNGKPYAPPGNYESPADKAMRFYVESKKEQEKKRQSLLNEALEFSFQEWLSGISDEVKNQIIPPEIKKLQSEQPKRAVLKQYFESKIWSKKYQEIIDINN